MVSYIDELELPKKVKNALKILSVVLPVLLFSYVIYVAFIESNNKKIERQIYSEKKIEFKGIVKQKYIDSLNHVRPTIKLYGGTKISSDYELYNVVRINDSISKENEELSIKIYRKKDDTINYKYIESVYRNSLYRNYK